jgi:hypothetical protein
MPIRNLSQAEFLKALQARVSVRYNAPPRLVLAFYYGWYGAPEVSGKWLHWEGVDAQRSAYWKRERLAHMEVGTP